jgi:hypothetical protein
VLGSTIIGLEDHTPENIDRVINYAVSHNADFHQFMLYTPLPGTPLCAELTAKGRMKSETECPLPDTHGQFAFNYHHPNIQDGRETEFLWRAFQRDFEVNGPSVVRVVRTTLAGWQRYKDHPDPRIRRRFEWGNEGMATTFAAVVAATRRYYRRDPALQGRMSELLGDLFREFGWTSRLFAMVGGPYVYWRAWREDKRLARGWTYEPPTFYEHNDAAYALSGGDRGGGTLCGSVTARITVTRDETVADDNAVSEPTEPHSPAPVDACAETMAS